MRYKSKKFNNRKTFRQLEKIMKGTANHRRLQIIALLGKDPESAVVEIAKKIKVDAKTISKHLSYLESSGLVLKRSDYNYVRHKLTKNGEFILELCKVLR